MSSRVRVITRSTSVAEIRLFFRGRNEIASARDMRPESSDTPLAYWSGLAAGKLKEKSVNPGNAGRLVSLTESNKDRAEFVDPCIGVSTQARTV